jgi:pimeloyl-ACP methyl ester carboxylesterase
MDQYRVIAFDRRGYQQSRGRQPLNLDGHAEDLRALVEAVGNDRPIVVFGHSYGGVVALRSTELGATFDAMVTYEPPLPWVVPRSGGFGELNPDPAAEAESFFRRMVSNSAWERMGEAEQQSRRSDGAALHDDLSTLRASLAPIDWASVTLPWTYGYGDAEDRLEYYESIAARLRHDVATITTTKVAHAGHGAHLSNPEAMVRLIDYRLEQL